MADAPLTPTQDAVVQALKDAIGVISSINGGHANRVMKNGEAVYWQRKEWIDWARLEVMPTIQAALDGLTRATPAATPDWYKLEMLKAAAKSGNPAVIAFAAQLAGVPPCEACGYVKTHCRCAALTQGAGAVEPVATVEALQARLAKLEAELDDLEAERDEALRGPWPEWAKQMKKTIRKYSGYDGFDDASEGIDLAAELDELMEHAVEPSAQQLQQAVARALAERDQRDREQQQNADARAESGAVIQQACEAAIHAKGTHQ